jgi:hypothetical protein
MKKRFLTTVFLGCLLLAPPAGFASDNPPPPQQDITALTAKAEKGDTTAQYQLAEYYFARVDDTTGVKWLLKSAEGGYAEAQNTLGFRYLTGKDGTTNVEEGRKWLTKAAEQGHAIAQSHLCNSYVENMDITKGVKPLGDFPPQPVTGTKEEVKGACDWCEKAANNGNAESAYKLGLLYAKGSATLKPDFEKAYYWLAVRNAPAAKAFKEKVGEQLTKEKREELDKKAQEFRTSKKTPPPPAAPKP